MLNESLRRIREERGFSQAQVAEYLNISPSAYSTYETGTRDVSSDKIIKLSKFYGVTTDYLYGIEKTNEDTSLMNEVSSLLNTLTISDLENVLDYTKFLMWKKSH